MWDWFRRRKLRKGFWQFVRDPRYRARAAARLQAWSDRLDQTVVLSDAEIPDRIRDLWNPGVAREAELDLTQQGARALQQLLAALTEYDFHPVPIGKRWNNGPPLERILQIVAKIGHADAVTAIEPFLRHQEPEFRQYAAHAIGEIGAPNCVEPIRRALRDPDKHVRRWALLGIHGGLREERTDTEFATAIFGDIAELVLGVDRAFDDPVYSILLMIDGKRAADLLLDEQVFNAQRRDLPEVIQACGNQHVEIPGALLKKIMAEIKDRVEEYPFKYTYGACLMALARQKDSDAESLAREAADWGLERVSEDAATAIVACEGIEDLGEYLWRRETERGFQNLNKPTRVALACLAFDAEVCNGGLAQSYANLYGVHARIALEGFRTIGATEAARILEESMRLFGPDGPSEDEAALVKQLSNLPESAFEAMEPLNSAYYKVDHKARTLRLLFVAEHAREILE